MLTLENHEFLLTPNSVQNFFNRSLLNNRYRRTSKRCFGSFIFLEQELANHRPWAKSNWFCIAYELKMNFIVLKGWGGGGETKYILWPVKIICNSNLRVHMWSFIQLQAHLFVLCFLSLISSYKGRGEKLWQKLCGLQEWKYLLPENNCQLLA